MTDCSTTFQETGYYQKLVASAQRPLTEGVVHPDQCPKIKIKGVVWAVPPRGQRLLPRFQPDGSVEISCPSIDEWPEVLAVLELIQLPEKPVCSKCGQPTGTALEATTELISALFVLAAKALRHQYDIGDEDLSNLLGFSTDDVPEWITSVLQWIGGTPLSRTGVTDPLADMQFDMPLDMESWGTESPNASDAAPRRKRRRRRKRKRRA